MTPRYALALLFLASCLNDDPDKDQVAKTGSRIQVITYELADGARIVRGLWDGDTQEDCDVREYADGTLRCVPSLAYNLGAYFRADTCAGEHVSVVRKELAPHSQFAIETDGRRVRVFRIGGTTGMAYQGTPDNCIPLTVDEDQTAYYPGEPLPSSAFVEAFEQRNP